MALRGKASTAHEYSKTGECIHCGMYKNIVEKLSHVCTKEREIAVEILVEAVEVPGNILQQQRRRARLTGVLALFEERRILLGIAFAHPHPGVPCIGDACKIGIERRPEVGEEVRKRVFEVAIFALAEAVTRHVNVATEVFFVRIERRDRGTFIGRQQLRQDCASGRV